MAAIFLLRKLFYSLPLFFGVTFISFLLMVYFGPDPTYSLLGKNPSQADIDHIRQQLGLDLPLYQRYGSYVLEILSCDFGYSTATQEKIATMLSRSLPISLMVSLPGFFFGNGLAILLALCAAYYRSKWQDKLIMLFAVSGMSLSLLIVIICFQWLFCSHSALDLFPVQGWEVHSFSDYLRYVTVPTLATSFVALGYNTRFFRAVLVEETHRDYVRTAKAFGCPNIRLVAKHMLKNASLSILTRLMFTIPYVVVGGSLLIESFFGIPGLGSVTYHAIASGDLPVVKAVVSISTLVYIFILILMDLLYSLIDPRIMSTTCH